ncbi:hypothetical protein [Clostridium botulinum]|uniref:hypothetical protein n=1 Tax=Clostridium botulinum TaxID=1491 RepID=UPI001C9B05EA|nr:hypothetical protein [Clostridium botulinum]MBY6900235.1 hypothetical protein [Clostridium botulinum]MBY6914348.1 hypothetical protein [Clostridium botulinum]
MRNKNIFKNGSSKPIFITITGVVIPWVLQYIKLDSLSIEQKYGLGLSFSMFSIIFFAMYYYFRLTELSVEANDIKSHAEAYEYELKNYKTFYQSTLEDNKSLRVENTELKKIIQTYYLNSSKKES